MTRKFYLWRIISAQELGKWLGLIGVLWVALPVQAAGDGKATCEILENGAPATGTLSVRQGEAEIANGGCGKAISVPPGAYTAVLSLDGALDGPEQRQPLSAQSGKTVALSADFATGLLEIRIQSQGKDTAGIAVIRKAGRQIGTLGSGVGAHLSTGSYEVVVRYRAQERRFDNVAITRGARTALDASFD